MENKYIFYVWVIDNWQLQKIIIKNWKLCWELLGIAFGNSLSIINIVLSF